MCLEVCWSATERFEKENAKKGKVTCYKVLTYLNGFSDNKNILVSPYRYHRYHPGTIVAKNANVKDRYQAEVYAGIHVYEYRDNIPLYLTWQGRRVVVPVTCDMNDFIAAGWNNDLVFTKVELSEKDYKEGLQKAYGVVE